MTVSITTKPAVYTAQDLERLSAQGHHYELVTGELREMAPPGGTHGSSTSRLSLLVGYVVFDKDLGETFAVVPDIVLETRSPNDTKKEVADKVALWLALGVRLVWELNPQTRTLTVYRLNRMPRPLGEDDTLEGEEVLPDLSVPIARLFPSF